jgi:hypothetical protein
MVKSKNSLKHTLVSNAIAPVILIGQSFTKKVVTRANVIAAPACEGAKSEVRSYLSVAAEESKIVVCV